MEKTKETVLEMTGKYNIVGMKKELQRDTIKRYSRRRVQGVRSRDVTPEDKKLKPMKVGKGKHGRDITPELLFYKNQRKSKKEYIKRAMGTNNSINIECKRKSSLILF